MEDVKRSHQCCVLIRVASVNRRKWDNCHLLISGSAAAGAVVDVSTPVLGVHRSPSSGESSFPLGLEKKEEEEAEEK